jgi:hypothetical protein
MRLPYFLDNQLTDGGEVVKPYTPGTLYSQEVTENRWEFGKHTGFVLTDTEKTYDNTNRQEIWKMLQRKKISKRLVVRVKNSYVYFGRKRARNLNLLKLMKQLDRAVFYLPCCSTLYGMR